MSNQIPIPIDGISDPDLIRVKLLASGKEVHAPMTAFGAASIHGAPTKATPVDADEFGYWDSVGLRLVKTTWASIKATLKTYFDTLYVALTGNQTVAGVKTFSSIPVLSGGAIAFPATQIPSAGANDLDDYEEGTFTPRIDGTTTAGAGTYSIQLGSYTKIGRQVTAKGNMTWSAHTGTGNMRIANLPFASAADSIATPINLSYSDLTFANPALGIIPGGVTTVTLGTAGTGAAFAQLPIDTAATLNFSGTYFV